MTRPDQLGRHRLAAAALAVLLVVAGCTQRSASPPPDEAAGSTTTTAGTSSTTAPATGTTAGERVLVAPTGDPVLDARMNELARFVEAERGREFLQPVHVQLLGDEAFVQRLVDDFDAEDSDDLATSGRVLQALQLVPPGTDLVTALRDVLAQGVLGFYDPETDELVVRGAELTPYAAQTVVHELVHALDDQHFDLDRDEHDDLDDETSLAFSVLAEGDASRVDEAWTDALSQDELRELRDEERACGAGMQLDVPRIVIELVAAPYEVGPEFVGYLLEREGNEGVDRSFAAPPTTSEQVLHPERYLSRDEPIVLPDPPADGPEIDRGVVGELLLALLLEPVVGTSRASTAAAGWGGDRYVAWDRGDAACIRFDVAMDTPDDVAELRSALEQWARPRGATVERLSPDLTRVTSCA